MNSGFYLLQNDINLYILVILRCINGKVLKNILVSNVQNIYETRKLFLLFKYRKIQKQKTNKNTLF